MAHIIEKGADFTVEVFVVFKNKVLLRKHDKYKKWLSVGGHIDVHKKENPNQAAIREVKEEVGLDIQLVGDPNHTSNIEDYYTIIIPPRFMNQHPINKDHDHITLVYFARAKTDEIKQSTEEVSEEIRWFTEEELDSPEYGIGPLIKMYAKAALKN
jgi:ADP-ribose pyrophosphatase YjhB (NUDIX family)